MTPAKQQRMARKLDACVRYRQPSRFCEGPCADATRPRTALAVTTPRVTPRAWTNDTVPTPEPASILLVDDNDDVRASMRRALAQDGHNVVEAESGDTAAALIAEAVPFDMLVTDVRMPGSRDGVALASCWHEKAPDRPVLFVSGDTNNQLDLGALGPHQAMLHKPFRRASLLNAVRRLLGKMRRRT
jgi:CheY-like chemotaxis protein